MHCIVSEYVAFGGSHPFVGGLATLWIFSAAVSAMCEPDQKSSQAYQWLYRFTHLLAANLDRSGFFNINSGATTNEPIKK